MTEKAPDPIFTFRGHSAGVTAVTSHELCLISGDEDGTIIVWQLATFKRITTWNRICKSKIQSLRVIKLQLDSQGQNILVAQTRDNGVHLYILDLNKLDSQPEPLVDFQTYESLFSRGDAVTISESTAILAYPSSLESYMITVRYLGVDAKTIISGSAMRAEEVNMKSHQSVFDIVIRNNPRDTRSHELFAGYEDGFIIVYSFSPERTKTIPELNVSGLDISIVRKINLGLTDFISAFDVMNVSDKYIIISGSPSKELKFLELPQELIGEECVSSVVTVKRQGTSVIAIRPDYKLVATAGWDNTIRLFSMKSRKHLATLKSHTKQVSDIAFIKISQDDNDNEDCASGDFLMTCGSLDGTISVYDIY